MMNGFLLGGLAEAEAEAAARRRADIVLGDDVAVLSLYRLEKRVTWVLTGFGKRSNP